MISKNKRNTKIIATIGPASRTDEVLEKLIKAGANIFRFNLKHGTPNEHKKIINQARKVADKLNQKIEALLDVPGPNHKEGLDLAIDVEPEYVALSYVKKASEVEATRKSFFQNKIRSGLITKIETNQALNYFSDILEVSQSLMIARGDLGRSIPIEQVPFVQKEIVQACNEIDKMVIVATEMLLSMTTNREPTRAEASDVANAVLEGANAVMLSEETAIGKNPAEAVKIMEDIINEAEHWKKEGHVHIFSPEKKEFRFGA